MKQSTVQDYPWNQNGYQIKKYAENLRFFVLITLFFQGVHVDCILTTRGLLSFNCSLPMPPETVALYSCARYFKQISVSSPIKLMRCDKAGKWSRMEHFHKLKCEYGKFLKIIAPISKI